MAAEGDLGFPGSGPAGEEWVQSPAGEAREVLGPGCSNSLSPAPPTAGTPQGPGVPRQCGFPCRPLDHDPQHSAGKGGVCVQVRSAGGAEHRDTWKRSPVGADQDPGAQGSGADPSCVCCVNGEKLVIPTVTD